MDDDDGLDATLVSLIGAPTITADNDDSVYGQVVARARARIQRRRYAVAAAASVIVVAVGIAAFATNSHPGRELQVQAPSSSSTTRPATTVSRPVAAAKLGPCPRSEPPGVPGAQNRGIRGLATKLVPIDATNVRICSYGELKRGTPLVLAGFGQLAGAAANAFETTNNGLRLSPRVDISRCPNGPGWLLTFANAAQQVTVGGYCGGVLSNGTFVISNSQQWFNELDLAVTTDCFPQLSDTVHSKLRCALADGTIKGTLRRGGLKVIRIGKCPTQPVAARKRCLEGRFQLGPQLSGRVTISGTNGIRRQVTTTANKPFSVDLPLGIYRVTGTTSNGSTCRPRGPFMVLRGSGFDIPLVCK